MASLLLTLLSGIVAGTGTMARDGPEWRGRSGGTAQSWSSRSEISSAIGLVLGGLLWLVYSIKSRQITAW